jgi:hypothetical protein
VAITEVEPLLEDYARRRGGVELQAFMAGFEVTTEGNMTIWAARKGILAGIY